MEKIAIIGGGIVGSTTAYYLSEIFDSNQAEVTVYDYGKGQATKAAAGIISPWVSKRRNQHWYRLARAGAELIPRLAKQSQMTFEMYKQNGTIITRKDPEKLNELFDLATERQKTAPAMGNITKLSAKEVNHKLPVLDHSLPGIFISGGGQMNGSAFTDHLLSISQKRNAKLVRQKVELIDEHIIKTANGDFKKFDWIVVNTGAWMAKTLAPLKIKADVRPQKGQLIEIQTSSTVDSNMPVMMPEGERDFLPLEHGRFIIGATHEDDLKFDLHPSKVVEDDLLASAQRLVDGLSLKNVCGIKVGTRAYTSDYGPFFGTVPNFNNVLVGGGLGSSGLTTGPMIAKLLAQYIFDQNKTNWDQYTKPVSRYLSLM